MILKTRWAGGHVRKVVGAARATAGAAKQAEANWASAANRTKGARRRGLGGGGGDYVAGSGHVKRAG